ncbi:MAG: RNA-binding protein [Caulobacteraceae bacterium]|nr:RNA-binding protein [Caulobacteraceae bacterium]
MSEDCRIDVWLWRARFFKTRSMAARFVEEGRVRRTREGETERLDKAARKAKVGDELVFVLNHRLVDVRVEALGERRGPASEARGLYRERPEDTSVNSDRHPGIHSRDPSSSPHGRM